VTAPRAPKLLISRLFSRAGNSKKNAEIRTFKIKALSDYTTFDKVGVVPVFEGSSSRFSCFQTIETE